MHKGEKCAVDFVVVCVILRNIQVLIKTLTVPTMSLMRTSTGVTASSELAKTLMVTPEWIHGSCVCVVLFHGPSFLANVSHFEWYECPTANPTCTLHCIPNNRQYRLVLLQEGVNHFTGLNSISEM